MTGRTPSRQSSLTSLHSVSAQNAALLGATTAFGRAQPSKPRVLSNNNTGLNGALAAAATVGVGGNKTTPSPNRALTTSPGLSAVRRPASVRGRNDQDTGLPESTATTDTILTPQAQGSRPKPPVNTAAYRPTASPSLQDAISSNARPRAKTVIRPAPPPKPRRLSGFKDDIAVDDSPIPPTISLRDLFERKGSDQTSTPLRPEPPVIKQSTDMAIHSPKPLRSRHGGITSAFQVGNGEILPSAEPLSTLDGNTAPARTLAEIESSDDDYVSASESTAQLDPPLFARKGIGDLSGLGATSRSARAATSSPPIHPLPSPRQNLTAKPVKPHPKPKEPDSPSNSMSASSASIPLGPSISAQYHQLYQRKTTPLHTGDDLANAIVASSLASSRAPSPRKVDPPPPIPIRRRHHRHTLSFSRTPSPGKPPAPMMRHTLRKQPSTSASDNEYSNENDLHPYAKHQKKRLVRKHPNKHHEGDRKRWRDAVTERERARYEGVWASNKGLLLFPPSLPAATLDGSSNLQRSRSVYAQHSPGAEIADRVSPLVTKEIWARSRLPDAVLEAVWELVVVEGEGGDGGGSGRASLGLTREQFVAGLWLIDQRLRGRKLPVRVSESVWASVRGLAGIKMRKVR